MRAHRHEVGPGRHENRPAEGEPPARVDVDQALGLERDAENDQTGEAERAITQPLRSSRGVHPHDPAPNEADEQPEGAEDDREVLHRRGIAINREVAHDLGVVAP